MCLWVGDPLEVLQLVVDGLEDLDLVHGVRVVVRVVVVAEGHGDVQVRPAEGETVD